MNYNVHQTKKNRSALFIILTGITLGLSYSLITDEFGDIRGYLVGFVIGLFGSILIALFELWIFNPQLRRFSFIGSLITKTLFYIIGFSIIIIFTKGFIDSIFYRLSFRDYLVGSDFNKFLYEEDFIVILIYSLVIFSLIIFTRQMSRKMGYSVLINYVSGKYHYPKEEERIFLSLDLNASTNLAEQFGDKKYFNLLNDFFYDITKCILTTKGEIYRYVGDEVVVSWSIKNGLKNANCIRTYYYIIHELNRLKEKYLNAYGLAPQFSAVFNSGKVVVGEIGEIKSQIVYHGEVLYISSIIKKECSKLNSPLLITENLIKLLELPSIYKSEKRGEIKISQDSDCIYLYTLIDIDQ